MTTGPVLQIRGAVPSTPLELITGASTLTQVVLIVLALLSCLARKDRRCGSFGTSSGRRVSTKRARLPRRQRLTR